MRVRAGRSLLVGLVAVALSACGTTVTDGPPATSAADGGGLSVPTIAPSQSDSGLPLGTPSDLPPTVDGGGGADVSTAPTATKRADTVTTPTSISHGRADLAPVKIGFTTAPDASQFFASFGGSFNFGNQNNEIKAAVAWVNAHGGLNGHPIQPYIETVSVASSESYDSQYQKLCSKFTQDDHVIAATMVGIGTDDNMDACMNKAHTLFVTGSNTLHDELDYRRTPYVVSPSEITVTRLARTMTQLVLDRKLVMRGGRLGLVNYDIPAYTRAINTYVKPLLASAGVTLVQFTIPPPSSTPDIGNSVAIDQAAQLKMAAQGVKTVMFLCAGCLAFFAQTAKSQGYFPRYIFSSLDGPGGTNDKQSFGSAVGLGWEPVNDQDTWKHPKAFTQNPTYNLCRRIEAKAGNVSSTGSLIASMDLCEDVMDMFAAARANPTAEITSDSLLKGLLSLGSSHVSALDFATYLSQSRHAGAAKYRVMQWSDTCSCLTYSDPARSFAAL